MKKIILFISLSMFSISAFSQDKEAEQIFTIVETMPEYPGGNEALKKYIDENTRYYSSAKGTVYVSYVVNKKGEVVDVKLAKGIYIHADTNALQVVRSITGYKAGIQREVPVNVRFTIGVKY